MSSRASLRARFKQDAIETASPSKLLGMVFDRLCLNLSAATEAVEKNDLAIVSERMEHSQALVIALQDSLDRDWEHFETQFQLYEFLYDQLVQLVVNPTQQLANDALELAESLRDTWAEAASRAALEKATASNRSA